MKVFLVVVLSVLTASAQRADSRAATGTVAGTVTCTDTNLPGRLTDISLTPIRDASSPLDAKTGKPPLSMVALHQTRLDGTFLIPRVPPGRYYVIAQKPGYLSAASLYTKAQIDRPATPQLEKEIAETVPSISVAAGQTTTLDLRLHRAASVSGILRFDDGSPASLLYVSFSRRNPEGKWVDVSLPAGGGGQADDLGHFRAGGLPAGEYRMETRLTLVDKQVSGVFGGSGGMMVMNNRSSLSIYYGDTFFSKDARLLKLDDGQDASADITIPISRLHSVSGTLVDAKTGTVINAGDIEVLYPASGEVLTSIEVDADDPAFRLDNVPEGELTIRVTNPRLITRVPVPLPSGSFGTPQYKETLLQAYNSYEAPLTVKTDMQAVNLPLTAKETIHSH